MSTARVLRHANSFAWLAYVLTFCACSSSDSGSANADAGPEPTGASLFAFCSYGNDCQSEQCLLPTPNIAVQGGFCTQPCDDANPCPSGICGVGPDNAGICFPDCEPRLGIFSCDNGVPKSCSQLDQTYCSLCGCGKDLQCRPGVGCIPISDVGGWCDSDYDCKTEDCSPILRICRVPVGSNCTSDNCDRCLSTPKGYSYCSRRCSDDYECNGGRCVGDTATNTFYCVAKCSSIGDSSCPGTCKYTSGDALLYCDCGFDCSTSTPANRPIGAVCDTSNECASKACYHVACTEPYCGVCSTACKAAADCGQGLECVNVPCADGAPASLCGPQCLATCTEDHDCQVGNCLQLQSLAGQGVKVCDVRLPIGSNCSNSNECLSSSCTSGKCK